WKSPRLPAQSLRAPLLIHTTPAPTFHSRPYGPRPYAPSAPTNHADFYVRINLGLAVVPLPISAVGDQCPHQATERTTLTNLPGTMLEEILPVAGSLEECITDTQ